MSLPTLPGLVRIARTREDAPPEWRWAWEGLLAAYVPELSHVPVGMVGAPIVAPGKGASVWLADGLYRQDNTAGAGLQCFLTPEGKTLLNAAKRATILTRFVTRSAPNNNTYLGGLVYDTSDGTPYTLAALYLTASNDLYGGWSNGGGSFEGTDGPQVNATQGVAYTAALSVGASNAIGYLDGRQVSSKAIASAPSAFPTSATTYLGWGQDAAASTRTLAFDGYVNAAWYRVLAPNEVARISADPVAMFRWRRRITYSVPSAPTEATGTGSGSFAVAGSGTATVAVSATGTGSFTVAGSGTGTVAVSAAGAGSAAVGGSGTATIPITATGSGSVTASGSGTAVVGNPPVDAVGSGGFTVTGSGTGTVAVTANGSSGFTASGSGEAIAGFTPAIATGSGGFTVAGSGTATVPVSATGAGSATVSGSGTATVPVTGTGSGGFTVGGTGEAISGFTPAIAAGSGGFTVAGSATATVLVQGNAVGIFVVEGSGLATIPIYAVGAGSFTASGSATALATFGIPPSTAFTVTRESGVRYPITRQSGPRYDITREG